MKKLVIKYCGGCNPAYDRVALVKQIIAQLNQDCPDWQIGYQSTGADRGLMICGCDACCIDKDETRAGVPEWNIIGPDMLDYYQLPQRDIPHAIKDILTKGEEKIIGKGG